MFFNADWRDCRSPKNEVFKISKGATFLGGRIQSIDSVIFNLELLSKISEIKFRYFQTRAVVYLLAIFLVTTLANGGIKIFTIYDIS